MASRIGVCQLSASATVYRAHRIWKAGGMQIIDPHECRHTFATLMIAAGVNVKALQTFMGHASVTITLDRYGHLLPGSENEAAELLDRYLSSRSAS
jgi:integrase